MSPPLHSHPSGGLLALPGPRTGFRVPLTGCHPRHGRCTVGSHIGPPSSRPPAPVRLREFDGFQFPEGRAWGVHRNRHPLLVHSTSAAPSVFSGPLTDFFKKDFIFKGSFRFTEKLRGRHREFPYISSPQNVQPLHRQHPRQGGPFVTVTELQ